MKTSISDWLDNLGGKSPSPGGGAVAGMNAALSAATLRMVCEYSTGPKFAGVEAVMKVHIKDLKDLVLESLEQAEEDAKAYQNYINVRSKEALEDTVQPAISVIKIVGRIIEITEDIQKNANRALASDIVVSAANARSALESAIVNIEINAALIENSDFKTDLSTWVAQAETMIKKIDSIIESIRKNINRELK